MGQNKPRKFREKGPRKKVERHEKGCNGNVTAATVTASPA